MTSGLIRLARDNRAASAAEFALVLPLLLLLLLGMLDVGRLMWTWNRAEKATQMGVRYAVATDVIPTGLATYSFATGNNIPQGDPVDTSYFDSMTCTSTTCDPASYPCIGSACSSLITPLHPDAFTNIVNRMRLFYPEIDPDNVLVSYRNVGLGYAGDPNGPDVAPLVTVRLRSTETKPLKFNPITLILFNAAITLPSFSAALTMEDGQGNVSN